VEVGHGGGGGGASSNSGNGERRPRFPRQQRAHDDVANALAPTATTTATAMIVAPEPPGRRRRLRRRRGEPSAAAVVAASAGGGGDGAKSSVAGRGGEDPATTTTTTTATATMTTTVRASPDDVGGRMKRVVVDDHRPSPVPISKADHDATLALLRSMDWDMARNTSRRNVIRKDDPSTPRNARNKPYCMSFVLGRNMKDPAGGLSFWSTQYPDAYAGFRDLLAKYIPDFEYTHITVNRNLRCQRHTDGGNVGPSLIAGFGNYEGGGLLVEPPGGGTPETVLDLRGKFAAFDGKTQPHETMKFEGERFTLVYYTSDIVPGGGGGGGVFVNRSDWEYRGGGGGGGRE
jgi:hypothetical protein